MSDAEIRALQREAASLSRSPSPASSSPVSLPSDPVARHRLRLALVRAGRGAEAGFEIGDLVRVEENRTNLTRYSDEPWTARLVRKEDWAPTVRWLVTFVEKPASWFNEPPPGHETIVVVPPNDKADRVELLEPALPKEAAP